MEKDIKKLNFGCGEDGRKGWDNWDYRSLDGVEKVDFNKYPYPAKDNTYDYIKARQILQLLEKPDECLLELWRITKKGGTIFIESAYYNNFGSHNDIKVTHAFSENTFKYFVEWNKDKFKIKRMWISPTLFGKFLVFESVRKFLNLFISGIYDNIEVELEVLK